MGLPLGRYFLSPAYIAFLALIGESIFSSHRAFAKHGLSTLTEDPRTSPKFTEERESSPKVAHSDQVDQSVAGEKISSVEEKASLDQQIASENKTTEIKKTENKAVEKFPNISLTDETGREVKFYDDLIKGHIVMINFIFTKCQKFCPAETARLRRVHRALGKRMGDDIRFISVSIDPQNDTPEVLREYKKKFDIGQGWSFLTGKEDEIKALRMKLGLLSKTFPDEKTNHSLDILVGNESTGKWMRRSSMDSPEVLAKLIGENLANWSQVVSQRVDFSKAPLRSSKGSAGEDLFRQKCMDCHSIGGGDGIGPDLIHATSLREKEWLRNWIKTPDLMIAGKDPIATALVKKFNNIEMPNLGITDSEVEDILSFLTLKSNKYAEKNKEAK